MSERRKEQETEVANGSPTDDYDWRIPAFSKLVFYGNNKQRELRGLSY
jgi:hypothetical protein